jgi:transcriptional regulator with XRE-family HTH domain
MGLFFMTIGQRLKIVRGNKTQYEFAELLSVHPNTVARYERGERSPDAEYIERIFKRFKVSPQWLMSGVGEMYPLKKIMEIDSSIEKILDEYQEAGVIPDFSVSDDEFAIIKLLRSVLDSEAVEIIKQLFDKFINSPSASADKFLKKSSRRVATILNKGHFDKGIDIEQKLFNRRKLEAEMDVEIYDFEIHLIDLYEKSKNKKEFIEKLKRTISRVGEKNN